MLPIALTNGSISGPVESVLGWRLEDDAGRRLFNGAGANETDRPRFFCPTIRGHLGCIASLIDIPFPACPVPPLPLSPVPASSWYALSLLSSIFPLVEVRVLSWGDRPLPYRYLHHTYRHPDMQWCRPPQRNVPAAAAAARFESAEKLGEGRGPISQRLWRSMGRGRVCGSRMRDLQDYFECGRSRIVVYDSPGGGVTDSLPCSCHAV
jgi:hypothetical protein